MFYWTNYASFLKHPWSMLKTEFLKTLKEKEDVLIASPLHVSHEGSYRWHFVSVKLDCRCLVVRNDQTPPHKPATVSSNFSTSYVLSNMLDYFDSTGEYLYIDHALLLFLFSRRAALCPDFMTNPDWVDRWFWVDGRATDLSVVLFHFRSFRFCFLWVQAF